jgi:peptidoglycan/LPS O-acetylase OafA/YrhL
MSPAAARPQAVSDAVPRRLIAGDGLRAIAAMSVLVYHAAVWASLWSLGQHAVSGEGTPTQFKPIFGAVAPVFVNLRSGIYIFFALSGYLLTRPFLAAFLVGTPNPSIARYCRNRALRIVPAFWVVTTGYLIWAHGQVPLKGLIAVYGFAQNYHYSEAAANLIIQAWTLDLEAAFYVLIPLAALLAIAVGRRMPVAPRGRLALVLAVLGLAYVASLLCKHAAGSPQTLTYNIADYLFAFLPGVALAAVEPLAAPRVRGTRAGRIGSWALLGLSALLLALFVALPVAQVGARLILVTLGCGALLAAALVGQWTAGGGWRALDNRPMRWLGQRSYGIYLIHLGLITHVVAHLGHGRGVRSTFVVLLIAAGILTLIAADLLWRVVERPALERRLPWRQAEFRAVPAA